MNVNQVDLDRLVDGELDGPQRRDLIARLADQPDGWRQCALAFLEAQSVRAGLASWAEAGGVPGPQRHPEANSRRSASDAWTVSGRRARWRGERPWLLSATPWLSLAACALVAFTLGRFGSGMPDSGDATDSRPGSAAVTANPAAVGPGSRAIPLIVTYQPDLDMFGGESALPRDIEQHLRDQGVAIQRHKGLLPVVDAAGNRIMLPYEDIQCVPVQRQVR